MQTEWQHVDDGYQLQRELVLVCWSTLLHLPVQLQAEQTRRLAVAFAVKLIACPSLR